MDLLSHPLHSQSPPRASSVSVSASVCLDGLNESFRLAVMRIARMIREGEQRAIDFLHQVGLVVSV